MTNTWIGLIAVLAGLLFCFRGFLALRTLIAIWGAFVGFAVGAALTATLASEGVLVSGLSWVISIVSALVFAWLAYAFYAVGVILTAGSTGYMLGLGFAAAVGAGGWLPTVFGLVGAAVLALLALVTNLPKVLLALVSASAGAAAIIIGAMILAGLVDVNQMTAESWTGVITDHWGWNLAYLVLFVAGLVSQLRFGRRHDVRAAYGMPPAGR